MGALKQVPEIMAEKIKVSEGRSWLLFMLVASLPVPSFPKSSLRLHTIMRLA